jgi:putative flippase GtrA
MSRSLDTLVRHAVALLRGSLGKFAIVGAVGLSFDATLFSLLHAQQTPIPLARAISLICATLITWRLNRVFTFRSSNPRQGAELTRYAAVAATAQGMNYLSFLAIVGLAPDLPPVAALVMGAVCAGGFSFAGQRFFTFARQADRGGSRDGRGGVRKSDEPDHHLP